MTTPTPLTLPEVATASSWCQRWRQGSHSWRHVREDGFDARRYRVEAIDEATARSWVLATHYSGSYPAACRRYGLFAGEQVVGACGTRWSSRAWCSTTRCPATVSRGSWPACSPPRPSAGCAVWSPSPTLCRVTVGGRVLFAGHTGHIYVAANAAYLGRSTARTMTVLPSGAVLSPRSTQKVGAGERGHDHVERQLVRLGATPRRPHADPAAWLTAALNEVCATRIRHAGNHRYAFRLGRTARLRQRVRLGLPSEPRPVGVDRPPPAQLALFPGG